MNEQLKQQHLGVINEKNEHELIKNKVALDMYSRLCTACDKREGGMTDIDQMLVADIARAEQIKQALLEDIAVNGLGRERYNGRQTYYAENKSLAQYRAYAEQQRKQLAELRLTPNSRKASSISIDDEFDDF